MLTTSLLVKKAISHCFTVIKLAVVLFPTLVVNSWNFHSASLSRQPHQYAYWFGPLVMLFPITPCLITRVPFSTSRIQVGLSNGRNRRLIIGESLLVGSVWTLILRTLQSSFSKGFSSSNISLMVIGPSGFGLVLRLFVNPFAVRGLFSFLECFIVIY